MREPETILGELDNWASQVRAALGYGEPVAPERLRILAGIACLEQAPVPVRLAVARCVARLVDEDVRGLGTVTAFEIACAAWNNHAKHMH
jgi:hypothetical protein